MVHKFVSRLLFASLLSAMAGLAFGNENSVGQSEDADQIGFGSRGNINRQLKEDRQEKEPLYRFPKIDKALQPWFDWKASLTERHGFQLGIDYNMLYQKAEHSLSEIDDGSTGIFRIFGKWELLGRGTKDTGALFLKLENRHKLGTDISAANLAGEIGYLGVTGTLFNDLGSFVNELNWQQYFNDGRTGLILGRYDPNDYMDVSGFSNPWSTFQNVAVLFNPSIALPDTSWGVGAGHWFKNRYYLLGSVNDANGVASEFDGFEEGGELFKQAGFGWTPDRSKRYTHNLQLTAWESDEREEAGVEQSNGIALNANWTLKDNLMIFGRAGWSDGAAPLYNDTYTLGVGRLLDNRTDVFGIAVNWGDPSADELSSQTTTEVFYRLQLTKNLAITPSLQWLNDPAFNPEENDILIAGIRIRLAL